MSRRRTSGEAGSVLIEALIAVLIVAVMSGLWFETVSGTARQQYGMADRRTALLVAQSQLATVGVLSPLAPGETTGSDAGLEYRIAIAGEPGGGGSGSTLARVTVTVGRPGGPPLATLQTLRVGR